MKKRRQHYVWQHYLRAWAVGDQISCLRDGRVFRTTTDNVAVRKDFYRLQDVTAGDLRFLEEFCLKVCDDAVRPMQRETIKGYTFVFDLRRACELRGGDVNAPEFEALFDEAINNWEEDHHAAMESRSIRHLERLRSQDIGFLQDDGELASFLHYLSFQCMRTDKMRSKCIEALPYWPGFDAARSWGLLAKILATNMSYSFFMSRRNLHATLLVAGSDSQFITSDQPVINLDGLGSGPGRPPEHATLYYPVSPTTALLLEFDRAERGNEKRDLEAKEVDIYNHALFLFAHEQVFATAPETLGGYPQTASAAAHV